MSLIFKYKKEIIASIGIIVVYLISRTILLSNLPIFTDEAIYVRWTQVASNDASWRFISLTDGKQPMLVWLGIILLRIFDDPLVAVRMVSVSAGLVSVFGLFFLTYELFKNKLTAFIASFLYVIYPFAIVYDRLAIYDSLVTAFAVWAIYFSILLVRKVNLHSSYTLSFALGAGLLTKSSAIFSIYLLPFTLLLFDFKNINWKRNLIKWILFVGFSALLAQVFYNVLRFSPFFSVIIEKNAIFVYPFSDWIEHPFTFFFGNLKGLMGWLFTYLTPFFIVLILISFSRLSFIKEKILLFLYFLLPFIALALFGKVIFPRFIFFMSIYLLPLAAVGLTYLIEYVNEYFKKRHMDNKFVIGALVLMFFSIYPIKVSIDYIFNPEESNIAQSDKDQYVSSWPAGTGIKESVEFFQNEAKSQKIHIATQGTFGLLPYAYEIYLLENKNITTQGVWPIVPEIPEDILDKSIEMPVYFVFYQPCDFCKPMNQAPESWPLTKVMEYKKAESGYSLIVYRVN